MYRGLRFAPIATVLAAGLGFALPGQAARARGIPDLTREGFPNIQSATALVVDLDTDSVLYERDADTVRPIASVSKLVGALVIHEECRLDPAGLHEMTSSNRDAARGGDKTKLTTGWRYSHRDLLHAALMRSDNRALPALGEACGLSPATFGERMTARVRRMGLIRTTFKEPNGLSSENVSTARELAVILKHVIRIPELTAIMSTREYEIVAVNKNGKARGIKIKNTDRLLSKNVAEIIGGKTGYTDIARYCFAVAARTPQGRPVGMIFLGAEGRHTRFADFTRVIKWLDPFERLAKGERLAVPVRAAAKPEVEIKPSDIPLSEAGVAAGATGGGAQSEVPAADTKVEGMSW